MKHLLILITFIAGANLFAMSDWTHRFNYLKKRVEQSSLTKSKKNQYLRFLDEGGDLPQYYDKTFPNQNYTETELNIFISVLLCKYATNPSVLKQVLFKLPEWKYKLLFAKNLFIDFPVDYSKEYYDIGKHLLNSQKNSSMKLNKKWIFVILQLMFEADNMQANKFCRDLLDNSICNLNMRRNTIRAYTIFAENTYFNINDFSQMPFVFFKWYGLPMWHFYLRKRLTPEKYSQLINIKVNELKQTLELLKSK